MCKSYNFTLIQKRALERCKEDNISRSLAYSICIEDLWQIASLCKDAEFKDWLVSELAVLEST